MDKALVVDNHGMNPYVKGGLEGIGYNVSHIGMASDAIKILRESIKPQLVISDVNVTNPYNGISFVRDARVVVPYSRIFLWSGKFGSGEDYSPGSIDHSFKALLMAGTIDGYSHKSPDKALAGRTMVDLVLADEFEHFARKYGIIMDIAGVEGLFRILNSSPKTVNVEMH